MSVSTECQAYRTMILGAQFHYGVELVTTRGIPAPGSPGDVAASARDLLANPRVGWISVTDNPGGGPMLPPDWLASQVADHRSRIVVHLACKDLNRNGLEAAAWRYAAEGFQNVLALTGDYPTGGFAGTADPVFDLDSTGLIVLLNTMNKGMQIPGRGGKVETLPRTSFFIGCAVSPFKFHEYELVPQYLKLVRKIAAGAQWVIPQLGYDMRKFHEIKLMLESRGLDVPVVGNVYLLTKNVARMFNAGQLAGCVVSDELLELVNKYSAGPDKGRSFFNELAAKQLAVFKGLGFASGYLGGMARPDTFSQIIEIAEHFGPHDWIDFLKEIRFSRPGEFFLFEHDTETGMSGPTHINRRYLESLKSPEKTREITLGYRVSSLAHDCLFTPDKAFYPWIQRIFQRWEKKPGVLGHLAYWFEKKAKRAGFDCQDCGDCSLPDCAYLCPMVACSKHSRNGPCGGSDRGRCELGDKDCFWARVYQRLKYSGQSERMFDRPVAFYNSQLKHTSSWANTYLGKDHSATAPKEDPASAHDDSTKG
ncbi:MAG: methylenetetrahydrofolate reductase C-terminal domain-containing protein [Thermoguttaceae bacterium]